MSQKIIFEQNGIKRLGEITDDLNTKSLLLITGKNSYEVNGAKNEIEKIYHTSNLKRFIVSTRLPEITEVERGISFYQEGSFDTIIAIGGGTVLDTAKLIRFFALQDTPIAGKINNIDSIEKTGIRLIAIPTTAGSGAEATHFAVCYINKTKYSLEHQYILPDIALVDPELTLNTPIEVACAAGMDALAQGIESYWSVNSTHESQEFSKQAITLAYSSLIHAICGNDKDALRNLSLAALRSGQAINISKTTAPHAVSYSLTANHGILHGHAVALTLGEFIKHTEYINDDDVNHPLGKSHVLKIVKDICEMVNASDSAQANNNIKELMSALGLNTHLSEFGIKEVDYARIVQEVNIQRLSNHPQKITREVIEKVLRNIA